jgi:hypothetical protein
MASQAASRLKARLMDNPDECFEPLTFGELKVGQKFVSFPLPGDNHGHGGFRGAHFVFTKTHDDVAEAAPGMPYGIPHGQAHKEGRGVLSDFPHSMLVILVE